MSRRTVAILCALALATAVVVYAKWITAIQPPAPSYPLNLNVVSRFTARDAPPQVEQVVMLLEFPPHAWTPVHAPGGDIYNTVYQGEVAIRRAHGADEHFVAGDDFVEFSGEWIAVGNDSDSEARVIATALLPLQAPLAVSEQGFMGNPYVEIRSNSRGVDTVAMKLGPAIIERAAAKVEPPDGAFAVVQWMIHLEPGEWTPRSAQQGDEVGLVASGAVTVLRGDDIEMFSRGQIWTNTSSVSHSEGNEGEVPAEVVISELGPR